LLYVERTSEAKLGMKGRPKMFVSKKEWNKLQNKINRLESELLKLKSEQEITTDISEIKFAGPYPYRGFKTISLWRVVKMILSHLDLEITEEPTKEAKFNLVKRKLEESKE
jgi:hypothetical protein